MTTPVGIEPVAGDSHITGLVISHGDSISRSIMTLPPRAARQESQLNCCLMVHRYVRAHLPYAFSPVETYSLSSLRSVVLQIQLSHHHKDAPVGATTSPFRRRKSKAMLRHVPHEVENRLSIEYVLVREVLSVSRDSRLKNHACLGFQEPHCCVEYQKLLWIIFKPCAGVLSLQLADKVIDRGLHCSPGGGFHVAIAEIVQELLFGRLHIAFGQRRILRYERQVAIRNPMDSHVQHGT